MSTAGVMQEPMRARNPRRLLVDRAAVLLGRVFRSLSRGYARWRRQAGRHRQAAQGGGLGAVMGRALAARGARGRMLVVEERLTLGPKQHMYLIRCGEQRLLVASAGEAALQWMPLPEQAGPGSDEACGNTVLAEGKTEGNTKRRGASAGSKAKGARRGAAGRTKAGRAEAEARKTGAGGAR